MNTQAKSSLSIVMLGATGAVGSEAVKSLTTFPELKRLTLLGRRPLAEITADTVSQHLVDIFSPSSYLQHLEGHSCAICTLGVGQPSKISKEEFIRVDKLAVLDFATACKQAGIHHFQLLASVGADPSSRSFYLRTKGELIGDLQALEFERLSIFQPSMILTPTNRYGLSQALTLWLWPLLTPILLGPLRQFRGIPVAQLGQAIARNSVTRKSGEEILKWDDFIELNGGGQRVQA